MQQKQAAERLGVSIGAVHNWVKAYREGGMAALQPRNRNASQANKPATRRDRDAVDAEALRRRIEDGFLQIGVHSMGTIFQQYRRLVSSRNCVVGSAAFFLVIWS